MQIFLLRVWILVKKLEIRALKNEFQSLHSKLLKYVFDYEHFIYIQLNKIIRLFNHITVEALQKNYIFAALNQRDLEACMLSMEFVEILKGDNIITQGFRVISF